MALDYPRPRKDDVVETWFGHELAEPYGYMRDGSDPEVREWVARENALTDAWFGKDAVEARAAELRAARMPRLFSRVHPWRGGYLASRPSDAGSSEHVLLASDLREVGPFEELPRIEGFETFDVDPCPLDESVLAVFGLYLGAARPTIVVYDTAAREVIHEVGGTFSAAWSRGDGRLYASATADAADGGATALLAFDPRTRTQETILALDGGSVIFGNVACSSDGTAVVLQACEDYSLARWYALDTRTRELSSLAEGPVEWTYVDTLDGAHHFVTMSEAENGAVVRVAPDGARSVVLPEDDLRVLIAGMGVEPGFVVGGELFVICRRDVSRRLLNVTRGTEVPLPSEHADLVVVGREAPGARGEKDGEGRVLLGFTSFVDPPQLLAFDGESLERVYATSEATHPGVVVEQRFAPSPNDGTLVPYYLVHREDAPRDGSSWALMYAYGGYNTDMPPWYTEMVTSINVAEWVEAGNVYVHANIRGGSEYGPRWHEAGMLDRKRTCYEDYLGVARRVIEDGWTSAGRIAITGCSNGGLLNSALLTMAPELWGCVIDSVPQTDMVHVADDDRGPMYVTEYGDPRSSEEMFLYLLSYSPYHNLTRRAYPPTYVQTGECDNNVPPYHGKKFAARLQEMNEGDAPTLLRVLERGSHNRGGTSEEYWRTTAEMRLFIERAMGR